MEPDLNDNLFISSKTTDVQNTHIFIHIIRNIMTMNISSGVDSPNEDLYGIWTILISSLQSLRVEYTKLLAEVKEVRICCEC